VEGDFFKEREIMTVNCLQVQIMLISTVLFLLLFPPPDKMFLQNPAPSHMATKKTERLWKMLPPNKFRAIMDNQDIHMEATRYSKDKLTKGYGMLIHHRLSNVSTHAYHKVIT
jgi:hypothetical protein